MNKFNSINFTKINVSLFLFTLILSTLINDLWNVVIVYFIFTFLYIYFIFLKKITYQIKEFQLFDLRIFTVSMILLYSLIPLIGWCISGFDLNEYSDNRTRAIKLNSKALFIFYFKTYFPFFITFIAGILFVNKKHNLNNSIKIYKNNGLLISMLICLVVLNLFFSYVNIVYEGFDTPLIIRQLKNIFGHYRIVCYFLMFLFIFLYWKYKFNKFLILIFLIYSSFQLFDDIISRTTYFKQLIAIFLAYSIVVKPIKLKYIVLIAITFLPLAIIIGAKNENMIHVLSSLDLGVASNEWWSIFGTAYDINRFHVIGFYNYTTDQITNIIPNYMLFNDIYYLIPQQFIFKVDPSLWYLHYIESYKGIDKFGIGFTWGSLANIALWNNIYYTFFYGFISGIIIGLIHNYYISNRNSIYATLIYLCACIYAYGIVRVGTGYFLYEMIYRVIPFVLILVIMTKILEALSKESRTS